VRSATHGHPELPNAKEPIVLDKLVDATVSRHPVASATALGLMSLLASVALTACDAAAEHHPTRPMGPTEAMGVFSIDEGVVASVPEARRVVGGGAALREYREDTDPSHAAIGSYGD
jgi:hypothetical protein